MTDIAEPKPPAADDAPPRPESAALPFDNNIFDFFGPCGMAGDPAARLVDLEPSARGIANRGAKRETWASNASEGDCS